ncbi:MAG TPA: hypothetical protein DCR40_16860 [Prolixibacteraceae bacterium]|nr:hypothetical protein [Prolixibacteraceae bacterium]
MKTLILLSVFLFCNAQLSYGQWSNTNLSVPRSSMGSTTLGNKAYFAGGHNGSIILSSVETYDVKTGLWEIIGNLNTARQVITGVSCGSKVFFAGGVSSNMNTTYSTVDIYDTITRQWSVKQLSIPRFDLAAVSKGNKVLFAGGCLYDLTGYNVVDIYNTQTDSWSTANLSIARGAMAYAVVGDLAIFAGGILPGGALSNRVDIYNFVTDTWSTATLSQARCWASATTMGNKVLIAGGMKSFPNVPSDRVDIYDASNGTWSTVSLFSARAGISSGTVNGKAYFAGGSNVANGGIPYDYSDVIDIYDGNTWSKDVLPQPRCSAGLVLGDKFLIVGGKNNTGVLSSVAIFKDPTPVFRTF